MSLQRLQIEQNWRIIDWMRASSHFLAANLVKIWIGGLLPPTIIVRTIDKSIPDIFGLSSESPSLSDLISSSTLLSPIRVSLGGAVASLPHLPLLPPLHPPLQVTPPHLFAPYKILTSPLTSPSIPFSPLLSSSSPSPLLSDITTHHIFSSSPLLLPLVHGRRGDVG